MRIVWISYDFGEYSLRQVRALATHHEVLLVLPSSELVDYLSAARTNLQIYRFNNPRLRQPLRQAVAIRSILKRINAFRPDVIHYQQGHLWFNAALPLLRRFPLVVTIHDPRHHQGDAVSRKTPQWVLDFGFRRADQVLVHGQQLVDQVVRHLGIARERIHVVPHVAMGETSALPSPVDEEDPNVVLFFGRIWQYKGLEYLIRAEPLISHEFPNVRIVIAGEGEEFERYRRMMVHPERFVIHNHWVSDERRAELFKRAALVVLPYAEATQSGVVPVAYEFSKPVVATRVGALHECVEHEQTGLLVAPRNEGELAEAIRELLRSPAKRHAMGTAGKLKLQRECAPHVVARQTAQIYQRALGVRQSGGYRDPRCAARDDKKTDTPHTIGTKATD